MKRRWLLKGCVLLMMSIGGLSRVFAQDSLAQQAVTVLKTYCHGCHGIEFEVEGFDVLDREVLLDNSVLPAYVAPGDLTNSYLWQMVSGGTMPPKKAKARPTDAEVGILREWILQGAPFPAPDESPVPLSEVEPPQSIQIDGNDLGERAFDVFEKYCYRCHGIELKKPGLEILNHAVLLEASGETPYVVAGDPESSLVWKQLVEGSMPPRSSKTRPTEQEKQIIRDWILAGAPEFPDRHRAKRPFISEKDTLSLIPGFVPGTIFLPWGQSLS